MGPNRALAHSERYLHVATREDVYCAFGRAYELAQLFETELGTALMAFDGLKNKRYADPDPIASRRALGLDPPS